LDHNLRVFAPRHALVAFCFLVAGSCAPALRTTAALGVANHPASDGRYGPGCNCQVTVETGRRDAGH
jgi:hypothetical protein